MTQRARAVDIAGAAPGDHHRRAEEEEGPTGENEGLEEFPDVNIAGGDGEGEQEIGFAILEEAGVADDRIGEDQHREEEAEDEEEEALRKEDADEREVMQVDQADIKERVTGGEVAKAKSGEHGEHEAGFLAEIGKLRAECGQAGPEDEAEDAEGHGTYVKQQARSAASARWRRYWRRGISLAPNWRRWGVTHWVSRRV
jgi:hypothetical protein